MGDMAPMIFNATSSCVERTLREKNAKPDRKLLGLVLPGIRSDFVTGIIHSRENGYLEV